MPTISFYHSVPDKLAAACRLVEERFREGRKVLVFASDPHLAERFDIQLWSFASLAFVPHCGVESSLAAETPVLIATRVDGNSEAQVLLNLSSEVPPGFERFEEVIEVVGNAEEDAGPARNRFRIYKERGFPPQASRLQ